MSVFFKNDDEEKERGRNSNRLHPLRNSRERETKTSSEMLISLKKKLKSKKATLKIL